MNNIKFRGISMSGHWYYGLLTKKKIRSSGILQFAIVNGNFTLGETIPIIEDTICRFTGATDVDNKEIYEGDILNHDDHYYLVKWVDDFCSFMMIDQFGIKYPINYKSLDNLKIVGDFYNDPRLLRLFQK